MFTKERLETKFDLVYSNGRGVKEEGEATKERLETKFDLVYSNGRGAKEEGEATKERLARFKTRGRHGAR